MKVLLNDVVKIKQFVNLAQGLMSEVDVLSGHYILDGKSIMGLHSLDLSRPVEVRVNELVPSEEAQFEKALKNIGCVVEN